MLAPMPVLAASAFDRLYPASGNEIRLPHPFGDLLADLSRKSGAAEIQTGFVPLGRSLHRYAADPDYFASPRIIAGVTGEGTSGIALKDRLYLGYQPASEAIEIISYDEALGRFVFQEVIDYGPNKPGRLRQVEDAECGSCHQAKGPIFAAAPWSESNANPAVIARLGKSYHGLPVKQDFVGLDLFDRSTQRANRLTAAAMLWRDGCSSRTCRAALLGEVLRFKLEPKGYEVKNTSFVADLAAKWPKGLALANSKIPDRDPVALLANATSPSDVIETTGVFNPETPRAPLIIWQPGQDSAAQAVRLVDAPDLQQHGVDLVDDVDAGLDAGACTRGAHDGADGVRHATTPTDHPAHVAGAHGHLKGGATPAFGGLDAHGIGVVHQFPHDELGDRLRRRRVAHRLRRP